MGLMEDLSNVLVADTATVATTAVCENDEADGVVGEVEDAFKRAIFDGYADVGLHYGFGLHG